MCLFLRKLRHHTDWALFGRLLLSFFFLFLHPVEVQMICVCWKKGLTFSQQVGSVPAQGLLQAERQVFPETPGFHVPCITLPQLRGFGPGQIPSLLPPLCLNQQWCNPIFYFFVRDSCCSQLCFLSSIPGLSWTDWYASVPTLLCTLISVCFAALNLAAIHLIMSRQPGSAQLIHSCLRAPLDVTLFFSKALLARSTVQTLDVYGYFLNLWFVLC